MKLMETELSFSKWYQLERIIDLFEAHAKWEDIPLFFCDKLYCAVYLIPP